MLDGRGPGRPRATILVVDDEMDILESLQSVVEVLMPDVQVLVAPSADEGLRLLARHEADVVVSDLRMPGTDGLRFLDAVRHRHPRSRRILMTAYGGDATAAQARAAGVGEVLRKPFAPEEFCARIGQAVATV